MIEKINDKGKEISSFFFSIGSAYGFLSKEENIEHLKDLNFSLSNLQELKKVCENIYKESIWRIHG